MKYETQRHKDLKKRITGLAVKRKEVTKNNIMLSKKLRVSVTTISHYMAGHINDQYLAEDLIVLVEQEIKDVNLKK